MNGAPSSGALIDGGLINTSGAEERVPNGPAANGYGDLAQTEAGQPGLGAGLSLAPGPPLAPLWGAGPPLSAGPPLVTTGMPAREGPVVGAFAATGSFNPTATFAPTGAFGQTAGGISGGDRTVMINETMVTVPEVGKKVTVQTGQEKKVYKRAMCKMPVGERKRFRKSPSGSSDGSPSAVPLRVFHPEEADRIAVRIQQELDTKLFTLKNKIYKDYMPEIVGWHRSGAELARGGERPVISSFRRKPICFLNAAERGLLEGLPPIEQINFKHITDDATRALLIDTITSVANKVLFLLLVEYKSWYLQKNVRGELSLQIAQLIWGDKTTPQAVDFVRGFIDERSRNFRDVVSRVFKRNAIRNAS